MLEERLRAIEDLLSSLDRRLKRLEVSAGFYDPKLSEIGQQIPPTTPSLDPPLKSPQPKPSVPISVPGKAASPEEGAGGGWLGAIGILFFILAASFFVKLAIDSGWLTPKRQLAGLYLFGISLIFVGFRLRNRDAGYAGLLPAAGTVVLYMAGYAGHLYFDLYNSFQATVVVCAISAYSFYLFTFFKYDFFLIAAICGTYSVPLLLSRYGALPFSVRAYFIIWDLVYVAAALFLGRRSMIALTAYAAISVSLIAFFPNFSRPSDAHLWGELIFHCIQFGILAAGAVLFTTWRRMPLKENEAWLLLPLLFLFYLVQGDAFLRLSGFNLSFLAIAFAALVAGLYYFARTKIGKPLPSAPPIVFACFIFLLHAIYFEILPDSFGPWFALSLILLLYLLKEALPYKHFWTSYLLVFLIFGFEYLQVFQSPASRGALELFVLRISYGGFFTALYLSRRESENWFYLGLGLAQLLVGLQGLAEGIAEYPVDKYLTSALWGGLALAGLLTAMNLRDRLMARAAVMVFAVVSMKVLFNDISSSDTLTRVIGLVVIGALLYTGGLLLRRINSWQQ